MGSGCALPPVAERLLREDAITWTGWRGEELSFDELLAGWRRALDTRGAPGWPGSIHCYAHFAYCRMDCRFCQYWHAVPPTDSILDGFVDHQIALLARYRGALGRVDVSTAYFGGGTPTALTTAMMRRYMEAFSATFRVRAEFSCEAHPATVGREKLAILAAAGVNRISMGLQSFDPAVLRTIARTNGGDGDVAGCVAYAQELGVLVNLDLVLGLPGQTRASFDADLWRCVGLGPDMLTVYRFNPVRRLTEAPPPSMALGRVFGPGLLGRMLRAGYVLSTPVKDGGSGVNFLRVGSRRNLDRIRLGALYQGRRLLGVGGESPIFPNMEASDAHMIGLGPGAISHLYGTAWYRDVTALEGLSSSSTPVYWGSRVSPEEERRAGVAMRLSRPGWHRVRAGRDPALHAALRQGEASGALRRVGPLVKLASEAPGEARNALLLSLLPAQVSEVGEESEGVALRFRLRKDVMSELVKPGRERAEAQARERNQDARREDRKTARARARLGITEGSLFQGVPVQGIDGRAIYFAVEPPPAEPMCVVIEPDEGQRFLHRAGGFVLYYRASSGPSLTAAEQALLRSLGEAMAQLDEKR